MNAVLSHTFKHVSGFKMNQTSGTFNFNDKYFKFQKYLLVSPSKALNLEPNSNFECTKYQPSTRQT